MTGRRAITQPLRTTRRALIRTWLARKVIGRHGSVHRMMSVEEQREWIRGELQAEIDWANREGAAAGREECLREKQAADARLSAPAAIEHPDTVAEAWRPPTGARLCGALGIAAGHRCRQPEGHGGPHDPGVSLSPVEAQQAQFEMSRELERERLRSPETVAAVVTDLAEAISGEALLLDTEIGVDDLEAIVRAALNAAIEDGRR